MPKNRPLITGHMVVKNEDRWVYFAIHSVLPYVGKLLITDTGSTDHTLQIIRGIRSRKIELKETIATTPEEVTAVRQAQLERTTTDWFWLIDGDEIYPQATAQEVIDLIAAHPTSEGVVVKRYDLLGDVYHRQDERVGTYHLFGRSGHLVIRALNKRAVKGLHLSGAYPLEGYYDQNGVEVIHHSGHNFQFTNTYLFHAMYLVRSSLGGSLLRMINRNKCKIESGYQIPSPPPAVFFAPRPAFIQDPLTPRGFWYELLATIITPLKKLKRHL